MEERIRSLLARLGSADDAERFQALQEILALTDDPVEWFDEAVDDLVDKLSSDNSFQRSIGILVLCNLAKSDRHGRMRVILPLILPHTKDEKFITSRQCLQNIWKVALCGPDYEKIVTEHLCERFASCGDENHGNLLRLDALGSLVAIRRATGNEDLGKRIDGLVDLETDEKAKRKLRAVVNRQAV